MNFNLKGQQDIKTECTEYTVKHDQKTHTHTLKGLPTLQQLDSLAMVKVS